MFTKIILAGLIIFIGYQVYMTNQQNFQIEIEKEIIKIKNLPLSFEGVKIIQLSDFHSSKFGKKEKKVIEIVNQLEPDFIFITGDFVKTNVDLSSIKFFWKELSGKCPGRVFAVLGNHDHWHRKSKDLKNHLKESQIDVLVNESRLIRMNNEDYIYLIGVDDPYTGRDNLSKAMEEITNKDVPKILLAHSPDIIKEAKKEKIDLVLAGHLHGGQIVFPIIGPLFVPSKYGKKYLMGLFKENSTPLDSEHLTGYTYLYVNRGIGNTILPIRINTPPEITLIKLEKLN